jgi:hypothetical protein
VQRVIVHDSPPQIEHLEIDQHAPAGDATLTATLRASDPDRDVLTEQRTWSWSCHGSVMGNAGSRKLNLAAHGIGPGCQVGLADRVSDGLKSATAHAGSVTVIDREPVVGSVTLSPALPIAGDVVTAAAPVDDPDGDVTTTSCGWMLDETPLPETSCTLDLAAAGATKGQTLAVAFAADDGTLTTSSLASTEIGNAPPAVSSVSIDNGSPQTGDTLSAAVVATDADGDPVTLHYRWMVNGSPVSGATQSGLDLTQVGQGDRGDQVRVQVRVSDGESSSAWATSDPVTVANTPPVLDGLWLSTDQPVGGEAVSITTSFGDADDDPITIGVTWKLNGVAFDTGAGTTVPSAAVRGDTLTAVVTASDGTDSVTQSVDATIADAAPVVSSVAIDNQSPQTDDVLSAVVDASDAEGDAVTFQYRWLAGGSPIDGASGDSLDLSQAGNGDRGDQISVEVRAGDGEAWSSWSAGDPVTIGNTSPQIAAATIVYDPATGTATLDTSSSDADSDPLNVAVAWTVNGQDAGSASTLDLQQAGAHLGDVIGARAQVTDSDAAVSGWAAATPVTADTGPPALVDSGVMPWAIMRQSYIVGTGDVIYTDGTSPNDGAVSLPSSSGGTCVYTSGATSYRDEITGALAVCPLSIGQIVDLKTGQNSGATAQGVNTRITSYQSVDQIVQATASGTYIILSPSTRSSCASRWSRTPTAAASGRSGAGTSGSSASRGRSSPATPTSVHASTSGSSARRSDPVRWAAAGRIVRPAVFHPLQPRWSGAREEVFPTGLAGELVRGEAAPERRLALLPRRWRSVLDRGLPMSPR